MVQLGEADQLHTSSHLSRIFVARFVPLSTNASKAELVILVLKPRIISNKELNNNINSLKTKAVNGVQKLTVLRLFFFIAVVCHLRAGDCQSTLRHMA